MRNRWHGRGSGWKHVGGKYRNDVDNYKERWWEKFNRLWNVLLKSIEKEKNNMKAQKDERRQKDHFRRSFPMWKKLLMRISRWWYQIHLRHSCNQEKLEKIVVQFQVSFFISLQEPEIKQQRGNEKLIWSINSVSPAIKIFKGEHDWGDSKQSSRDGNTADEIWNAINFCLMKIKWKHTLSLKAFSFSLASCWNFCCS